MPHITASQLTAKNKIDKKADKARMSAIMEDTPLFAGLDDYILKQTVRIEADTAKAGLLGERKKTARRQTKKVSSPPLAEKIAKPQKAVSTDSNSMLLSVTEICALLKISRATLVRMDKSGQLPGRIKLGGSVRFHRETVETWLQSLIITHPAPP